MAVRIGVPPEGVAVRTGAPPEGVAVRTGAPPEGVAVRKDLCVEFRLYGFGLGDIFQQIEIGA